VERINLCIEKEEAVIEKAETRSAQKGRLEHMV
jgi:hypothetical protein